MEHPPVLPVWPEMRATVAGIGNPDGVDEKNVCVGRKIRENIVRRQSHQTIFIIKLNNFQTATNLICKMEETNIETSACLI